MVAYFLQSIKPEIKMIAAEPKNVDDSSRSLAAGKRVGHQNPPNTICDALK